jgi:hypothetical protein
MATLLWCKVKLLRELFSLIARIAPFLPITHPSIEGTVSIGVCGVFPVLHSISFTFTSARAHGAIVAVVIIVMASINGSLYSNQQLWV